MPDNAVGRVRVLISRDGSAVSVTRVDEAGKVLSVIWQREVSDAGQPLSSVFEQLPEPNLIDGRLLTVNQALAELGTDWLPAPEKRTSRLASLLRRCGKAVASLRSRCRGLRGRR
ncbi:MAG TPA: hypothetical protein PKJ45_10330 [Rubrivivax sp.]|nr:hypothetical protein [Rubrivivax sp.]